MTKFESGVSGNLLGRPKGALNKRTQLNKLLESQADALVNKAIEMALSGESVSLRLCIERLIPRVSRESIGIEFTDDEEKMKEDVFKAVLDGRLGIDEAEKLLTLFKSHFHAKSNYKLDTMDATEASKIYQQIMTGTYR
jgi:uncharacterized protein DUF5681